MAVPTTRHVTHRWRLLTATRFKIWVLDWVYEMDKPRGAEATPIVVDGVMYVTGSWSVVYAIDAKNGARSCGRTILRFLAKTRLKAVATLSIRGVAVHNGKVFVGVFDGRLEALDAASGEVLVE